MFYKNVGILLGVCLTCEELVGGYSQGRWILFYKVSFFKRIGKAGTKLKGIEENDNGQWNRSMVN
jgi:hypothetical protein